MSGTTEGTGSGELTLAFELSAFERFANPNQVIADAGEWSRYVGVIGNDTDAVRSYVREHHLRQDFELGDRDKWLALSEIRQWTATSRHVFVGTSADDRRAAEQTGWEFVPVREAAEKAGWELDDGPERDGGLIEGLRTRLAPDSLWPFGDR